MVTWPILGLFVLTAIPIAFAPGPSVAFVLTCTLRGGRRAGVSAVAGVETGYLAHVTAAIIGLSAILAASAEAFTAIKLLGTGYLVWLGVKAWRSRDQRTIAQLRTRGSLLSARRAFRQGLIVGALNPKTAVFFLAFLPQFVVRDAGPGWVQLAVLGMVFILVSSVPDVVWALGGAALSARLRNVRITTIERISGTVYFGLAAFALTARRAA